MAAYYACIVIHRTPRAAYIVSAMSRVIMLHRVYEIEAGGVGPAIASILFFFFFLETQVAR